MLCGGYLVGVVVFSTPMFQSSTNKEFFMVATKVVKFYDSIYKAANFRRTTPKYVPTKSTKFSIESTSIDSVYDIETEATEPPNRTLEKILISTFLGLLLISLVLGCCYCCYRAIACPCPKVYDGVLVEYAEGSLRQYKHTKKIKELKWCGPKTIFRDMVVPFFFLLTSKD